MIFLEAVDKDYGAGPGAGALRDVTLRIDAGESFGVIGRSGAGKSTLLRLLNGLVMPTRGRVEVDGIDIGRAGAGDLLALRRRVAMIHQHFNLLSSRTAAGNVALPLEFQGRSGRDTQARVARLLDLVGLGDLADRYPAQLSGGQKQRVGIARALAVEPRVLLCDEITSALDPETTRQILRLLARIRDELGITVVLITHEMSVVREVCERLAVLDGGRLVESGPVAEVLARPQHPTTRALLAGEADGADPVRSAERLWLPEAAAEAALPALLRLEGLRLSAERRDGQLLLTLDGPSEARRQARRALADRDLIPTEASHGRAAAPAA